MLLFIVGLSGFVQKLCKTAAKIIKKSKLYKIIGNIAFFLYLCTDINRYPPLMRPLYLILGIIAVLLGTIGIFVPGLPTTPLVLLASWCFYHSSPKMQQWLLQSFLGRYIRDYRDRGGLTPRKRVYILLLMTTMVAISTIFFIHSLPIRIVVWVAGLIGCLVVGFVVPKAKE